MNWLYLTTPYAFEDSFQTIPTLEVVRQAVHAYKRDPDAKQYMVREQAIAILKQFQTDQRAGHWQEVPVETIHIINRVVPYLKPFSDAKGSPEAIARLRARFPNITGVAE